jgi:hypothetical protein
MTRRRRNLAGNNSPWYKLNRRGARFAVLGTFFLLLSISLFVTGYLLPPNIEIGVEYSSSPYPINVLSFTGLFTVLASMLCWFEVLYEIRFSKEPNQQT